MDGGMICPKVPVAQIQASGYFLRVTALQHGRQRNQPHGNDRSADDTGARSKESSNDDHRQTQSAFHSTEELRH